jgi:Zn-dependent protease with chaperone function
MQLYPRYPKVAPWLQLPGVLLIFLFTPLIISRIWDTCALPPGELRDMLTAMCRRHHVRVRELLLWRTFGGMINAAVMGFIAPLRFILLTDALLDMLSLKQIEAVMAHELAHVRRQHMFWLLLVVGVTSVILQTSCLLLAYMIIPRISQSADTIVLAGIDLTWLIDPQTITYIAIAITLVGWLLVFGWVSRRFERQADTFAVQHLTQGDTVDAQSAQTMIDALQQVAVLNHIPTTKRSWRHGSIAWRQQYLNTLVGLALDKLSINRTVLIIKIVAVTGLSLILGLMAASYKGLLPFE